MAKFIYIDNSNVFIEGQRVAAVRKGKALDMVDAQTRGVFHHDYRLDFGKLYRFLASNGAPAVGARRCSGRARRPTTRCGQSPSPRVLSW